VKYEYFIGLRYLRAKRKQTFVSVITGISVAGVMVGVAALIIVLSGMVGVQEYMRDKILGFNAHVIVHRINGVSEPDEVVRRVNEVEHVTGATPFIEGQVMLRGRTAAKGAMVRGVDMDTVGSVMTIGEHLKQGTLAALGKESEDGLPLIALGEDLKNQLGVFYGDEVSVIIPEGVLTPLGMRPRVRRFRVGAVYKFGFWEVDSSVALVSLEVASDLFNTEGRVDGVEVKTDNIYTVDKTADAIREALGPPYLATTWFQQQRQLFAALKMEQLLSGLVLSLIMLVAAFNIVSMLLMLVMEKYRDIAVLKSMGATDGGIMRIFMTQGTVVGVIGSILGILVGIGVCLLQMRYQILAFDPEVYQFSVVPMKITVENVLGVGIGASLISFLTTIYPSWQAARAKPAESLRYE